MGRTRPDRDDQQLYGRETREIVDHGAENPGPDQDAFPHEPVAGSDIGGASTTQKRERRPGRRKRAKS